MEKLSGANENERRDEEVSLRALSLRARREGRVTSTYARMR